LAQPSGTNFQPPIRPTSGRSRSFQQSQIEPRILRVDAEILALAQPIAEIAAFVGFPLRTGCSSRLPVAHTPGQSWGIELLWARPEFRGQLRGAEAPRLVTELMSRQRNRNKTLLFTCSKSREAEGVPIVHGVVHNGTGGNGLLNLAEYSLPLDPNETVQPLTLPDSLRVLILAVTPANDSSVPDRKSLPARFRAIFVCALLPPDRRHRRRRVVRRASPPAVGIRPHLQHQIPAAGDV
jgi:hypothetical protein